MGGLSSSPPPGEADVAAPDDGGLGGVLRSTAAITAITLAAKVVGFVEKQVIAYYFGADARVDAYFVALSIPMALFLVGRELLEPAFLPLFVRHLDAGRKARAWGVFAIVGLLLGGISLLATGAIVFGAETVAGFLAPGFDAETVALTASLVRWVAWAGVILAFSVLTSLALNGYRRFALPASGDLLLKLGPPICVVLLAAQLEIHALALGLLIGASGRIGLHLIGLAKELRFLGRGSREMRSDLDQVLHLAAPIVVAVIASQVGEFADNYFASKTGEGGVAARTFGRKIAELPLLLVPYALSIVALPHFSALAARGDRDGLFGTLGDILRGLALLFTLLAVATVTLSEPIVRLLFERGAFDASASAATAGALVFYGAGLVPMAFEAILMPFYFSMHDTRTPVIAHVAGVGTQVLLSALLWQPMGIGGIALALAASKTLKVLLLGVLLRSKHDGLHVGPVLGSAARIGLAGAATAGALIGVGAVLGVPQSGAPLPEQLVFLLASAVVGGGTFLAATLVIPGPERLLIVDGTRHLVGAVRERLGRRA